MFDGRGWLESIDHLVTDKQEVLDAIYNRFHGPDATETDPLTRALNNQRERQDNIMTTTINCFVDLGNKRRLGRIVRSNPHTLWVKIMIGARTSIIIKRHKLKHNVGGYHINQETD